MLKHQPNDVETSPDASPRYVHIFWASLELSGNTAGEIEASNTTPAHHRQEMNMFSMKLSFYNGMSTTDLIRLAKITWDSRDKLATECPRHRLVPRQTAPW